MRITPTKLRISACIGLVSAKEYLARTGQTDESTQLTPEEGQILSAPTSIEDLEQKLKAFPAIWERVQTHVMNLPPEKQKQGEMFLNSLSQYFRQMEQVYAQVKQMQQDQTPDVPWDEAVIKQWENKPTTPIPKTPTAPPDPTKEPKMLKTKEPWEEKFVEEVPKPPVFDIDPSKFDPNLKDLTPKTKEEKPEFALSPEESKKQKELDADIASVIEPANNLNREISEFISSIGTIPDDRFAKNPEKVKKAIVTGLDDLVTKLEAIRPAAQSLMDQFAFGAEL
jgi:hypothetical protein